MQKHLVLAVSLVALAQLMVGCSLSPEDLAGGNPKNKEYNQNPYSYSSGYSSCSYSAYLRKNYSSYSTGFPSEASSFIKSVYRSGSDTIVVSAQTWQGETLKVRLEMETSSYSTISSECSAGTVFGTDVTYTCKFDNVSSWQTYTVSEMRLSNAQSEYATYEPSYRYSEYGDYWSTCGSTGSGSRTTYWDSGSSTFPKL